MSRYYLLRGNIKSVHVLFINLLFGTHWIIRAHSLYCNVKQQKKSALNAFNLMCITQFAHNYYYSLRRTVAIYRLCTPVSRKRKPYGSTFNSVSRCYVHWDTVVVQDAIKSTAAHYRDLLNSRILMQLKIKRASYFSKLFQMFFFCGIFLSCTTLTRHT